MSTWHTLDSQALSMPEVVRACCRYRPGLRCERIRIMLPAYQTPQSDSSVYWCAERELSPHAAPGMGRACARLSKSFDDKLYGRSIDRLRASCLPDTGLHGVAAAHEGPEELVRVLCRGANYMAIH